MDHAISRDRIMSHPAAVELCGEVLPILLLDLSPRQLATRVLELVQNKTGSAKVGIVQSRAGRWELLASKGTFGDMPVELLAEALDTTRYVVSQPYVVAPLDHHAASSELLLLEGPNIAARQRDALVDSLAAVCDLALGIVRRSSERNKHLIGLESQLRIAALFRSKTSSDNLAQELAREIQRTTDSNRILILLNDRHSQETLAFEPLERSDPMARVKDISGPIGRVVQSHVVFRENDTEKLFEQAEPDDIHRLFRSAQNALCVPISSNESENQGALLMLDRPGGFEDSDERLVLGIAELAGQLMSDLQVAKFDPDDPTHVASRLVGESQPMRALRARIAKIAPSNLSVLVIGENGSGKELVSNEIHACSDRREQPFVAVNCASFTETLLESELFGHEKGAFTDAHESRPGKFELANLGTFFLDEIGDLSLSGQAKMLRALEEHVVVRIGGTEPISTDVRVIAATNRDLKQMVRDGTFREDLFFRLNVVTLEVPPLRRRKEDIVALAKFFLKTACGRAGCHVPQLDPSATQRLTDYPWPGNVRELRNAMERVAYLGSSDVITVNDLDFLQDLGTPEHREDVSLSEATHDFQVGYIRQQIEKSQGNMTEAARRMGLHRSNLYRKMHQLGMPTDENDLTS